MKEYKGTICENGTISRYNLEGQLHRENGPAIECENGYKAWYKNGERHREDGPAIEYASGNKFWFKNGKIHREDGPAIEWANGDKEWHINGEKLTKEEFNKRTTSCDGKEILIEGKTYILNLK